MSQELCYTTVYGRYTSEIECLRFFPEDTFKLFNYYKEKDPTYKWDAKSFIADALVGLPEYIPTEEIQQQNGTVKVRKLYRLSINLYKELEKRTEQYFLENEDVWGKFKVEKTSDEDFKSILHELCYKLDPKEEKMFGYWIWQVVNKLRGKFPEYPTFLGMVGKPADGKDFTLGQFQLALGCGDDTGLIPRGFSMSELDAAFCGKEFYSQGVVRFEEISARRKADIDTFKTVITNPKVTVKEKYKEPFEFLSRNSYCGTANESFQCMVNDTENRRIIEINWKSVKGEVSKEKVRNIFDRLIACCPEEEIYDEDEIMGYIHAQFDGDVTTDKIWSNREFMEFLERSSRVRVGQVKEYMKCSFAEARKFLQDERFFEYVETGRYYRIDNVALLDALNIE